MQLGVSQEQKPVLSQQQIQALRVLEMGAAELHAFLNKQALENPFIRYEGPGALSGCAPPGGAAGEDGDYLDLLADAHSRETIHGHLTEQAELAGLTPQLRGHVGFLIDHLDENGYLAMRSQEIAAALSVSVEEAKAALRCLQSFTPAGVGARSLRECLLLQLKRMPSPDPLAVKIVRDHLALLAKRRLRRLAELCGVKEADILRVQQVIVSLNPKPGNGFASAKDTPYAPPDLLVTAEENGAVTVRLNPDLCSRFQVDADDTRHVRQSGGQEEDHTAYIGERLAAARRIGDSLRKRESTLLACGEAIAARQREFFRGELQYPHPVPMQALAEQLGLHPSTVTRTLKNKSLRCDLGVFPLAFFFTRVSYPSSGGDRPIAFVRGRIAALIRQEPPAAPLSDRRVAERLTEEGISISRRAVTKHREAMGIPCSYARGGQK